MYVHEISSHAEAYLLLTGRLSISRSRGARADADYSPTPLTAKGLNRLESRLKQLGRDISELADHESDKVLAELGEGFDENHLGSLLGRGMKMALALEKWQQRAIWVLCRVDTEYPQLLKRRMGASTPPVIFGCGDVGVLDRDAIAIIGSRRADRGSLEFARTAGRQAAEFGFAVVSGGAKGVDQAAMSGVVDADGCTIGVLPNGLSSAAIASENRMLINDERLLLISPFDPGAGFNVGNAMGRNKLIFALSKAGLVVESDYNKGGTWAGATEQFKRLKFVPMFVRATGSPSRGLDELRKLGAREWPDPADSEAIHAVFEEIRSGASEEGEPSAAPQSVTENPRQAAMVMDSGEEYGSDRTEETTYQAISSPSEALFSDVRPHILAVLKTPKTRVEVKSELGLIQKQTDQWLARLVDEGTVTKLTRPARYIAKK